MAETTHCSHPGNPNSRKRRNNNNRESRNRRSRRRVVRAADSSKGDAPVFADGPKQVTCSVCSKANSPKYKCPKCRDTYCSIQCCRDHKERGCSRSINGNNGTSSSTKGTELAVATTSKYLPTEELARISNRSCPRVNSERAESGRDDGDDDQEEGWKITDSMKEAMKKSKWLRNELKDMGLRHIISGIVAAPDITRRNQSQTKQDEELEHAKVDYPRFSKFVDKLLVLNEVLERHGTCAQTDLDEWLGNEDDIESTQLILKPIHREARNLPPLATSCDNQESKSETESSEDEDELSTDSSSDESTSSDED